MEALPTHSVIPSWYQVPLEIKQLLLAAVVNWEDTIGSEQFILQALNHPETTLEVLVSAYRYFFYKHNNYMARRLAMQVMDRVKQEESLPSDWEQLQIVLRDRRDDTPVRLYLSAYTALGIMLARWGAFQAAIEIAQRIQAIDANNEFGAGVILNILTDRDDET
ncbi:MAG: hypothetical protein J7642_02440 [Cyanobacteria bacterium SBC]|nr:hypothetical protein [Cyanobacteria bacterium SBC]